MSAVPELARAPFSWSVAGRFGAVAYRRAGTEPDVVLVHGLAMSSAYYVRFASALFRRGWSPIAPDIPGFGRSVDAEAGGATEHAETLAAWADELRIRGVVWIGHSVACGVVARLASTRPDLVRAAVFIGPLWTRGRSAHLRFLARLLLDGMREPVSLYRVAFCSFLRAGAARWWRTWLRFASDLASVPSVAQPALYLAGVSDPFPDRRCVPVVEVEGAHACHLSHAEQTAEAVDRWLADLPTAT